MLRTFIQVLALALSVMSAVFLIKGVLQLSINDIAQLSQAHWGYNLKTAQSYCQQRADYIVGFVLLLCGSVLQGANLLWQYRICDFGVNKTGAVIAVIVAVVVCVIAHNASKHLYKTCCNQVETILNSTVPPHNQ